MALLLVEGGATMATRRTIRTITRRVPVKGTGRRIPVKYTITTTTTTRQYRGA